MQIELAFNMVLMEHNLITGSERCKTIRSPCSNVSNEIMKIMTFNSKVGKYVNITELCHLILIFRNHY